MTNRETKKPSMQTNIRQGEKELLTEKSSDFYTMQFFPEALTIYLQWTRTV